jgi:hypothetical protein
MKRQVAKLKLGKETLRQLEGDLGWVVGGYVASASPSMCPTGCGPCSQPPTGTCAGSSVCGPGTSGA